MRAGAVVSTPSEMSSARETSLRDNHRLLLRVAELERELRDWRTRADTLALESIENAAEFQLGRILDAL